MGFHKIFFRFERRKKLGRKIDTDKLRIATHFYATHFNNETSKWQGGILPGTFGSIGECANHYTTKLR